MSTPQICVDLPFLIPALPTTASHLNVSCYKIDCGLTIIVWVFYGHALSYSVVFKDIQRAMAIAKDGLVGLKPGGSSFEHIWPKKGQTVLQQCCIREATNI